MDSLTTHVHYNIFPSPHHSYSSPQKQVSYEFASGLSPTDEHDQPAMTSAAAKVFAIPELLEHILLLVGEGTRYEDIATIQQLFALRRVNKEFYHTIRGSPKIQRAMYLLPSPVGDLATAGVPYTINPLLRGRILDMATFAVAFRTLSIAPGDGTGSLIIESTFKDSMRFMTNIRLLPGTSWRAMLLTSSPCSIEVRVPVLFRKGQWSATLNGASTLGELIDLSNGKYEHYVREIAREDERGRRWKGMGMKTARK
ncbi:hypothetical protein LTR37_018068 [Vermiconidia calcicola]|uniref:Uncharacterized protein n=1 Tax=Vermiconidia calcicola TaxID=1690605 RepID=A0ACC3MJF0_9PEZI|nr:hypothetical protein LTR37_018068 [Vermiconidia calcicola]